MTELIITWQGLLFEAVSFLIFTYLLNLFLFRPIAAILKQRKDASGSNADRQNYLEKSIKALNEEAEKENLNLKLAIKKIKETLYREAQVESRNILSDVKIKAVNKFNKAIQEFNDNEKDLIIDSLKGASADLSILISKKIIE